MLEIVLSPKMLPPPAKSGGPRLKSFKPNGKPTPAFRVHVTGDLNKTISLVAGGLSTSFPRALLWLIH